MTGVVMFEHAVIARLIGDSLECEYLVEWMEEEWGPRSSAWEMEKEFADHLADEIKERGKSAFVLVVARTIRNTDAQGIVQRTRHIVTPEESYRMLERRHLD